MSDKRNIKTYNKPAGGWGALKSVTQSWIQSEKPLKNLRAMLKRTKTKALTAQAVRGVNHQKVV